MMPATARALGLNPSRLMEFDYVVLHGGRYLQRLIERYGVDGALRAYNAGETRKHLWHSPAVNAYVRRVMG